MPPITNDAEYREDLTVELVGIAVICALLLVGAAGILSNL